jgi:hypothetical protein
MQARIELYSADLLLVSHPLNLALEAIDLKTVHPARGMDRCRLRRASPERVEYRQRSSYANAQPRRATMRTFSCRHRTGRPLAARQPVSTPVVHTVTPGQLGVAMTSFEHVTGARHGPVEVSRV